MAASSHPNTEAALWEKIIHPDGPMSRETAESILQLSIPADEQQQMHELARKNQAGLLTADEEAALDDYYRVGNLFSLLKSRARRVLMPACGP